MMDQYSFEDEGDVVSLRRAWENVLQTLQGSYAKATMDRFLRPLQVVGYEQGRASFRVQGQFMADWVREKYCADLEQRLSDEMGVPIRIELVAELREKPDPIVPEVSVIRTTARDESRAFKPQDRYRFSNFVVGDSNAMAFNGAQRVAERPGTHFNPLFLFGHPGVGKTHLMHAIANAMMDRDPRTNVHYVNGQQFLEEYVEAVRNQTVDRFRKAHRNVHVWLLDDVQVLQTRDRTIEELFHTFNWLYGSGRQIVLCSDRPPKDLVQFDERLRSRFEGGLVVDIAFPDTETRKKILLNKAAEMGLTLSGEHADALAEAMFGNVRRLEGALNRLMNLTQLGRLPVTDEFVEQIASQFRMEPNRTPSVSDILRVVTDHYQIEEEELMGTSRKAQVALARHMAMFLIREYTKASWKYIGESMGGRDHTSVLHAYRRVRTMMETDKGALETVNSLKNRLSHPG